MKLLKYKSFQENLFKFHFLGLLTNIMLHNHQCITCRLPISCYETAVTQRRISREGTNIFIPKSPFMEYPKYSVNIIFCVLYVLFCVICDFGKVLWTDKNVDGISDYPQLFHTSCLYVFSNAVMTLIKNKCGYVDIS